MPQAASSAASLTFLQQVRRTINMVNLTTPAGLLLVKAGGAVLRPGPGGLILAEGYKLPFPTGGAFTVGNVVGTRTSFAALQARYPRVLVHEARHSTQYACLGVFFWPIYFAMMAYSMIRTGDRASRCLLERLAGLEDGGYVEKPVRPLTLPNLRLPSSGGGTGGGNKSLPGPDKTRRRKSR
jgi:hypothetical protein